MIDLTQHLASVPPAVFLPAAKSMLTVPIQVMGDIVTARQHGRRLSLEIGSGAGDSTLIATIISELARNVILYAKSGEIMLGKIVNTHQHGIEIVCRDSGPGIAEVQRALLGGYSTSGGLGMGLSGVRRIADTFHIDTGPGTGTTIKLTKWLR